MQTPTIVELQGHLEGKDFPTDQLRGHLKPSVLINAYNPRTEKAKTTSATQPVKAQPGL